MRCPVLSRSKTHTADPQDVAGAEGRLDVRGDPPRALVGEGLEEREGLLRIGAGVQGQRGVVPAVAMLVRVARLLLLQVAESGALGVAALVSTTVCGAVDPSLGSATGRLRRPPLPLEPPGRRLPLHAVHRPGDPGPGALDLRPFGRVCGRASWPAPGSRASTSATAACTATWTTSAQHGQRDRPARGRRGDLRQPDRRPRDRPGGGGAAAVRPDRLRDRPRQRGHGRGDAARDARPALRRERRGLSGGAGAALPAIAEAPGEPAGFVFSL